MAENYSVVDFSVLSATSDGNTLLYANNQVCKSDKTLGQLIDSKGYATEIFVTGAIDGLSGTVSTEYATKEELGKVGNFIVTEGDDAGPELDAEEAQTKSIYLIENGSGKDKYSEWIATGEVGSKTWTCIGDTTMDLSDYAKTVDVNAGLAEKEDKVFVAEYNVTSYADIKDAYDAGKKIICKYQVNLAQLAYAQLSQFINVANTFVFINTLAAQTIQIECKKQEEQTVWGKPVFHHFYDISATSGSEQLTNALNTKQDKLTAGTDLVINNSVIGVDTNGYIGNGTHGFVEGNNTSALGNYSHAEGNSTKAHGDYSHTEGFSTYTDGTNSHAEGYNTSAMGYASHAEGYKTTANGNNTHAEGSETSAAGSNAHAEGYSTVANNQGAHAEGGNTSAVGYCSHTEGNSTSAYGSQAHAEGNQTSAYGSNSHTEGQRTYASNDEAHAEGYGTSAIYGKTHAEGYESIANGEASHAEGYHTSAVMSHSHTEGEYTSAGYTAHAEGSYTLAAGGASHAEGYYTSATEYYSHAAGQYTSAGYNSETVVGKYNIISPNYGSNPLFVVGNGGWNTQTYRYDRSDAFVVLENGLASATKLAISGISDVGAAIASINQLTTKVQELETLLESYSGRWVLTPDTRLIIDGKVYNTITIGSQEWTVENLEADSFGGVWYNNDENTYKPLGYGKLYTLQEVNNITLNDGWRVPSVADFETLYASLENTSIARKLKSSSGWNGNDTIGFNLLPAGNCSNISKKYTGAGTESTLWTTDSDGQYTQWCMFFNNQFDDDSIKSNFGKTNIYSVRLVRDII